MPRQPERPQAHTTSPAHVHVNIGPPQHSNLQLDVVRRQRMAMRRQGSHSDIVHGVKGANTIKVFLYAWNVLIILLGLGLLCIGLYSLYYQESAHMVPTLAYNLATYTGLALALVSVLGLIGLQQQRRCTTEGIRNYALGFFIFLSVVGAFVIIAGGIIALTLRKVAGKAEGLDFTEDRVKYFETAVVTMLDEYVRDSPGGWRGIQNSMFCCGYFSSAELKASSKTEWEGSALAMVNTINAVAGSFCAKKRSDCSVTDGFPCPASGRTWCRSEVLTLIVDNYQILGVYAIVIGCCQVLSAIFSLFTLLCDVRMLRPRSPIVEITAKPLSPVRPR